MARIKSHRRPGRLRRLGAWLLHRVRQAALLFIVLTVISVAIFRFVPPPATPLMLLRLGEQWYDREPMRLSKRWTPLEQISPQVARAVIASEDQSFFDHHGFDFDAIVSAFKRNRGGRSKVGASTITQQTAKNLFLWPTRSWARKGLEAYFTVLLELLWSKRRILEVYLNVAETGRGVYGLPMASVTYYGTAPERVTREQAALLAACLPNPLKWSPENSPKHVKRRQEWILRQMDYLPDLPLR